MSAIEKLTSEAIRRLEKGNLIKLSKSLSDEMIKVEEVSEQDRRFIQAFQGVYNALKRVEEKTRELGASAANADVADENDIKERLVQLYSSLDRMQTAAFLNPVLQSFSDRVAVRSHEMSQALEAAVEKDHKTEFENLYDQFESLEER